MLEVNDNTFEAEILQHEGLSLVDFWAPWCAPCKMVGPIMEQLAADFDGRVKVSKLNVDEAPQTPGKYSIRGIPTVILFKNGEMVDQVVGARPKAHFEEILNKHLG
ncbi:MAG: thioredoxin [Candidatus Lernaella stagnicola]|nr:thioredoxin [Candidatus Lernaella stagnicola]